MKLNLTNIVGHTIINHNKIVGEITDIIFDEKKWTCRYFEVSCNNKRFLLPFEKIVKANWIKESIEFLLAPEKLDQVRYIDPNQQITRFEEIELAKLYKTTNYWETKYVDSMPNPTRWAPDKVIFIDSEYRQRVPKKIKRSDDRSSKVRRLSEIIGFEVFSENGTVGTLSDLIIDNKKWEIVSFVIKTYDLTGSHNEVLVASQLIKEVAFPEKSISVAMKRSEIYNSPDFDESIGINEKIVVKHFDFTGKPTLK